jgi:CheY-like chemotaxis protein
MRPEVLYVEDSAGDALLTGQILAEAVPSVKLTVARHGEQALAMLADHSFAPVLIILDLNLPVLSGFDVLKRNPRREIPVVVFSVSVNPSDMDHALAAGAAACFQKPLDLAAYRDAVLAMIDLWVLPGKEATGAAS